MSAATLRAAARLLRERAGAAQDDWDSDVYGGWFSGLSDTTQAYITVRHPRHHGDNSPDDRAPCEHWQGDITTPEVRDALGLDDEETTP